LAVSLLQGPGQSICCGADYQLNLPTLGVDGGTAHLPAMTNLKIFDLMANGGKPVIAAINGFFCLRRRPGGLAMDRRHIQLIAARKLPNGPAWRGT